MALAIRFDRLIKSGEVTDQADIARLGHVSRARVTQIMNLLLLAPGIQEGILFLPRTQSGRDPIRERMIHVETTLDRPAGRDIVRQLITTTLDWGKQHHLSYQNDSWSNNQLLHNELRFRSRNLVRRGDGRYG